MDASTGRSMRLRRWISVSSGLESKVTRPLPKLGICLGNPAYPGSDMTGCCRLSYARERFLRITSALVMTEPRGRRRVPCADDETSITWNK